MFGAFLHIFSHWQRLFLASKQWLQILILYTSCKTSYNVLSHSHWGLGQFVGGGGHWNSREVVKKRSLQILDLQILVSLLYVYICTSEWGQEECWRVEPILLKDNWESDISEHYPGNTLMREEWITSVDKGSSNNEACLYLVLTRITNLLMFI